MLKHFLRAQNATGNVRGARLLSLWVIASYLFCAARTFATSPVIEYQYRIVNSFAHASDIFTQGLAFHNGLLYESAGLHGHSRVLIRSLNRITPIHQRRLERRFFAEGITVLNNQLYQLTWRSGRGFIYQAQTLKPSGQFTIKGEGWGLSNNGKQLIISNGSDQLAFLDPTSFTVFKTLTVTMEGKPLRNLNELEWVNGIIYANIWQSHWIVMIDPDSGAVTGKVNLARLLPAHLRTASTDVLNGIAYDQQHNRLLVTGKHWPRLYQIELTPD